jgi:hypothetical protein
MIVSLFAAGWLAQQAPPATAPVTTPQATGVQGKPVSGNLKVRISTSTYMPDGRVLTTSASDWPLRLNEAVTAYASSGKTLCEPKAASTQPPELPAFGWRLEITPIREGAGELEVRVQWRQLGLARKQTFARQPSGPSATLTLHAGDRIVLDYVNATAAIGLFAFQLDGKPGYFIEAKNRQNAATPATAPSCSAVGMSLEVGLEPAKTEAIVEAELWLVRPNRDGTERSDRQVLRLPVGQPASRYFFDEARLADQNVAGGFAKVSGELSVVAVENGRIRFNFNVMRRSGKSTDADTSSTFRDLTAAIGEVVAFKLPPDNPGTDLPLSIRLRANVLR